MTTIETIMRNRKQKAEDKTQILKYSGVLDRKDLSDYLNTEKLEKGKGGLERMVEKDSNTSPSALGDPAFSFQVQDSITPKESLIGVSRSKSVNRFTIVNRKKVLSFLP